MILTANKIKEAIKSEEIIIEGFNPDNLNSYSYNLTPEDWYFDYITNYSDAVVFRTEDKTYRNKVEITDRGIIFPKGGYFMFPSKEIISTEKYAVNVFARSSAMRYGLTCSPTMGDLGYKGKYSVSFYNPVRDLIIPKGTSLAQVQFVSVTLDENPLLYNGRYGIEKY